MSTQTSASKSPLHGVIAALQAQNPLHCFKFGSSQHTCSAAHSATCSRFGGLHSGTRMGPTKCT